MFQAKADWLVVGLGNPGTRYSATRHNIGFEVAAELGRRWELKRAKDRFGGLIATGKAGSTGRSVAVLLPQTYMNESGRSVGPAAGSLRVPVDHVLVVHDEIDIPFGEVRFQAGGGHAGHNGLRSIMRELGSKDFLRIRVGVGRPNTTDREIVSSYVLGRFSESKEQVQALIESACELVEQQIADS